ncbi:protein YgfX [Candidatus Accumulibacter sp. ACC007]|uniref:protein YgfX n=1 Tax=Candidatus Accumulibacter sp. ACC007 TaxID=2823333 RepID=UPI0025C5AC54|nr:protein YgfX [Candidatus Accumulibacter sp. ACC007]
MHFPMHIALRRSRLLFVLNLVLHALATASVLLMPWPPSVRFLLLAPLALSLWQQAWRPSRVIGLSLAESGELTCGFANGEQISVRVQPDTVVFSRLVVLRVRDSGTARLDTLVLLPDSMPGEQFRVLRLWLRWRVDASGQLEGGV